MERIEKIKWKEQRRSNGKNREDQMDRTEKTKWIEQRRPNGKKTEKTVYRPDGKKREDHTYIYIYIDR